MVRLVLVFRELEIGCVTDLLYFLWIGMAVFQVTDGLREAFDPEMYTVVMNPMIFILSLRATMPLASQSDQPACGAYSNQSII